MRCPTCSSEDTRRLEVVYDEGSYAATTSLSARTAGGGVIVGSGGAAYTGRYATEGTGVTRGTTRAATKVAPPTPMTPLQTLLGLIAFSAAVGGVAWFVTGLFTDREGAILIGAAVGIALLARSIQVTLREVRYNREEFPRLMERWLRSWRCSRCGAVFEADAEAAS